GRHACGHSRASRAGTSCDDEQSDEDRSHTPASLTAGVLDLPRRESRTAVGDIPFRDVPRMQTRTWAASLVVAAVAVAFADSSIVVLALPELYTRFHTTITGVSWVLTAYNAAVAVAALALVVLVHRVRGATLFTVGLVVFAAASVGCAAATSLGFLIAARCVQGLGAALLLAASLPVLAALTGSALRGATMWTLAGTFGAALGPALGGVLTQAAGWRAIFIVQAPVALLGLLAVAAVRDTSVLEEGWRPSLARSGPANTCIGLLFGALVGVLFLSVLLIITVWGYSPIGGAVVVSVLPAATLADRPLHQPLPPLLSRFGRPSPL